MDNDKEYNLWNRLKKQIDKKSDNPTTFLKEREVWMSYWGKNIGFEQNGSTVSFSRPLLVIKKFNNKMFWAVPLSTKQKNLDFYYNFTDPYENKVSVILAQLRLLSIKRINRKMYDMSSIDFKNIRDILRKFI